MGGWASGRLYLRGGNGGCEAGFYHLLVAQNLLRASQALEGTHYVVDHDTKLMVDVALEYRIWGPGTLCLGVMFRCADTYMCVLVYACMHACMHACIHA